MAENQLELTTTEWTDTDPSTKMRTTFKTTTQLTLFDSGFEDEQILEEHRVIPLHRTAHEGMKHESQSDQDDKKDKTVLEGIRRRAKRTVEQNLVEHLEFSFAFALEGEGMADFLAEIAFDYDVSDVMREIGGIQERGV